MNRRGSVRTDSALTAVSQPPGPVAPRRRHCWVHLTPDAPCPGLVLEWRRCGHGWEARVVYVPETDLAVETWIAADKLDPA